MCRATNGAAFSAAPDSGSGCDGRGTVAWRHRAHLSVQNAAQISCRIGRNIAGYFVVRTRAYAVADIPPEHRRRRACSCGTMPS